LTPPTDTEPRLNFGPAERSRACRQLEILARHCFDLADKAVVGDVLFVDAVGEVYDAALAAGLVAELGETIVQVCMAAAFATARRRQ
jgi:hypothetical protein